MAKVAKKATKKAVKKAATKRATKKVAKKVAKRATKRAYTRKPIEPQVTKEAFAKALHETEEQAQDRLEDFSFNGELEMKVYNPVMSKREDVMHSVRELLDVAIERVSSASSTPSERSIQEARYNLAVARLEGALDQLEKSIRGS